MRIHCFLAALLTSPLTASAQRVPTRHSNRMFRGLVAQHKRRESNQLQQHERPERAVCRNGCSNGLNRGNLNGHQKAERRQLKAHQWAERRRFCR